MKNDSQRKIGGDVDRQLNRQTERCPGGRAVSPRQARCTRSDDVVHGLPSDFVSDLPEVMLEGAFKCYRHQSATF